MTKDELINRYLYGQRLTRDERSALAKQLGGAPQAAQAIKLAKEAAREACHDWQPAVPRVGWVGYCYVKYKQLWRVIRDGEIVIAYETEGEARHHAALLADDVDAEWIGKIADPHAKSA
jgi:hypothetical protein